MQINLGPLCAPKPKFNSVNELDIQINPRVDVLGRPDKAETRRSANPQSQKHH
jgi:hypothetical protein